MEVKVLWPPFQAAGLQSQDSREPVGASWQALDCLGSWSDLEHDMSRNTGSGVSLRQLTLEATSETGV